MFARLGLYRYQFELSTGLYMLEPWEKFFCYLMMVVSTLAVVYSVSFVYPQYDALLETYTGFSSIELAKTTVEHGKTMVDSFLAGSPTPAPTS